MSLIRLKDFSSHFHKESLFTLYIIYEKNIEHINNLLSTKVLWLRRIHLSYSILVQTDQRKNYNSSQLIKEIRLNVG